MKSAIAIAHDCWGRDLPPEEAMQHSGLSDGEIRELYANWTKNFDEWCEYKGTSMEDEPLDVEWPVYDEAKGG